MTEWLSNGRILLRVGNWGRDELRSHFEISNRCVAGCEAQGRINSLIAA